jgi:hypothetical protein
VSVVLALAAVAERPADSRSDPRTAPCHSTRRSRETSRPPPSARWTCCTSAARFDPVCAAAFPHPACDLEALLARLERAPVTAALKHPRTGADVEVTLTRNTVAEIVRVALYTPQDAARLLPVIRRALDGDFGPLGSALLYAIWGPLVMAPARHHGAEPPLTLAFGLARHRIHDHEEERPSLGLVRRRTRLRMMKMAAVATIMGTSGRTAMRSRVLSVIALSAGSSTTNFQD